MFNLAKINKKKSQCFMAYNNCYVDNLEEVQTKVNNLHIVDTKKFKDACEIKKKLNFLFHYYLKNNDKKNYIKIKKIQKILNKKIFYFVKNQIFLDKITK